MFIVISQHNPEPLYQQVTDQIVDAITEGTLKADEKLPSIREVSAELKISEITVKRAYSDLEKSGYIFTRAGMGSFVVNLNKKTLKREKLDQVKQEIKKIIKTNKKFGIKGTEIKKLINEVLEDINE